MSVFNKLTHNWATRTLVSIETSRWVHMTSSLRPMGEYQWRHWPNWFVQGLWRPLDLSTLLRKVSHVKIKVPVRRAPEQHPAGHGSDKRSLQWVTYTTIQAPPSHKYLVGRWKLVSNHRVWRTVSRGSLTLKYNSQTVFAVFWWVPSTYFYVLWLWSSRTALNLWKTLDFLYITQLGTRACGASRQLHPGRKTTRPIFRKWFEKYSFSEFVLDGHRCRCQRPPASQGIA